MPTILKNIPMAFKSGEYSNLRTGFLASVKNNSDIITEIGDIISISQDSTMTQEVFEDFLFNRIEGSRLYEYDGFSVTSSNGLPTYYVLVNFGYGQNALSFLTYTNGDEYAGEILNVVAASQYQQALWGIALYSENSWYMQWCSDRPYLEGSLETVLAIPFSNEEPFYVLETDSLQITDLYPNERTVQFSKTDLSYIFNPEVFAVYNNGQYTKKLTTTDYDYEIQNDPNQDFIVTTFFGIRSVRLRNADTSITSAELVYSYEGLTTVTHLLVTTSQTGPVRDPYDSGGTTSPDANTGGNGYFGAGEGLLNQLPGLPNGSSELDSSSTGMFTRYLVSQSTLRALGDFLYSDNIVDAVWKEIMSILYATPIEAVISLVSFPFNVGSLIDFTTQHIFFGNGDTGITANILNRSSAQIDWGTISLQEYWGNFLDYAPHTKVELYLPFATGFVAIDPHEVLPGTIQVVTNIEISKGTCVHNVFGKGGVCIGTYSGVCGSQLPITALDTSGKALAFVTAAVSTVAAAGAGVVAGAQGAAIGAGTSWGATSQSKVFQGPNQFSLGHRISTAAGAAQLYAGAYSAQYPVNKTAGKVAAVSSLAAARTPASIQRSGSFTANGAGMGIQYPYIIVSRPDQSMPSQYGAFYGYPSNVYARLGSLHGYTEVGEIHIDGIACTEDERAEIDSILKGGVIL